MRSAKKAEPEMEMTLTPEQEQALEEGLAALERGDYIEIEVDENTTASSRRFAGGCTTRSEEVARPDLHTRMGPN